MGKVPCNVSLVTSYLLINRFLRLVLLAALATAIAAGAILRKSITNSQKQKLVADLIKSSYVLALGESYVQVTSCGIEILQGNRDDSSRTTRQLDRLLYPPPIPQTYPLLDGLHNPDTHLWYLPSRESECQPSLPSRADQSRSRHSQGDTRQPLLKSLDFGSRRSFSRCKS